MDDQLKQAKALGGRLFTSGLAAAELMTAFLGTRLGLYEVMAKSGPITPGGLAERAVIAPRYAREWLEQQAACGIVEVDDVRKAQDDRLYLLPEGHQEVLIESDSMHWIAPMALFPVGGMMQVLPRLLDAYRAGAGVPYQHYGADFHGGQSGFNRAVFAHMLARWIRTLLPDLHARLLAGAQVADLGCGVGWASIALARAYPRLRIEAFDIDDASIGAARGNAIAAGVADRVSFETRDVITLHGERRYELVCIFDTLHDLPRPVEFLQASRSLIPDTGTVLLMEPNAADSITAPADETERFLYAISVLHCLPVGLSEQPSAATGTVMRPGTVRRYAAEAGFSRVDVIAVDHPFYRLYRVSSAQQ